MALISRRTALTSLCALLHEAAYGRGLLSPSASPSHTQGAPSAPSPTQLRDGPGDRPHTPWFKDVAGRSSIPYRTNNNFTGRKFFPQPMCGGVAAIDFDNDRRMDLFFTNGAQLPELVKTSPAFYNCLLRNKGDGTFEDVTAKAGLAGATLGFSFGVAVADYDNDGFEDIFICNAGTNTLYHNNGDGTFTDVTAGSGLDRKPQNVLSVARRGSTTTTTVCST